MNCEVATPQGCVFAVATLGFGWRPGLLPGLTDDSTARGAWITPGIHSAFTLGCENVDNESESAVKVVVRGVCPSMHTQCFNQDF